MIHVLAAAAKNTRTVTAKVYNRKNGPTMGYKEEKQHQLDMRYLRMARIWAENSYCVRRKVGALIVKDKMIISDGYNGTPSGFENVCEDDEGHTKPYVLHAEANAIISASRRDMIGATIYLVGRDAGTGELLPDAMSCSMCKRQIINAGIDKIVIRTGEKLYRTIPVSDWIENDDSIFSL